jgi:hypothetical protein
MSDFDKMKSKHPAAEPADAEDETIIDLVEEIEEPVFRDSLSPLEQNQFEIETAADAGGHPLAELADLEKLDFDEEEEQPAGDSSFAAPATSAADAPAMEEKIDWLFGPDEEAPSAGDGKPPDPAAAAIAQDAEAGEEFPETREMIEAMASSPAEADLGSEDEDLELIEIEDDEVDNELVWFDDLDLDKVPPPAELTLDADAAAAPLFDAEADLFAKTSAADVFAANVASGLTADDAAAAGATPPAAVVAAVASLTLPTPTEPIQPPTEQRPLAEDAPALSAEQIEAAVERVIERRLGGTLESIVLRAVESAVSAEIQRLKALLLEDDPGDRTP